VSAPALPASPSLLLDDVAPRPAAGGSSPSADSTGCSLPQLFSLVQQGDQVVFTELHRRTQRQLHAVVYQVLRSFDLTEDVVQDTYAHIWTHRHQYDPELGSLLGWMTVIARRRAIDRLRSLARTANLETRYATHSLTAADTDHQARVTESVHATAVTSRALTSLTATQREALLLTYRDGRTAAEAAQLLGIPVPTMKSRLHSATSRLRRLLDPHQLA